MRLSIFLRPVLSTLAMALIPLAAFAAAPLQKITPTFGPDELVVYFFPAPGHISFHSPRSLLYGYLVKGLHYPIKSQHRHEMGHTFFRLRCNGQEMLTGQTTSDDYEEANILKKYHYGLGYLGTAYAGVLDSADKLEGELQDRYRTGEMSYMRYVLSKSTSARLWQFMKEYHEKGNDRWWGEANRPRYGEGGACGSLVACMIELAGLMTPEREKAWTVDFKIPKALFGGPFFGTSVKIGKLILNNVVFSRWARSDEEGIPSHIWDPTLMHEWVMERWNWERRAPTHRFAAEKVARACGLKYEVQTVPTPADAFWKDPVAEPNMCGRQPGTTAPFENNKEIMARQRAALVKAGHLHN